MNDPTFDDAALACFRETLGADVTEDFRNTLAACGTFALVQVCMAMKLSQNDRKVFYGAARALNREIEPVAVAGG